MELALDYAASMIGHEGNMLAAELGIEPNVVDRLEQEYPRNPHEKTFHILYTWMNNNPVIDHMQKLSGTFQSLDRTDIRQTLLEFTKDNYKCDGVKHDIIGLENRDVEIVARKLAGDSYRLGRFLGIPQSRISQIKIDNIKYIMEQIFQMLDWWRKNQTSHATRQNLCDGLVYVGQRNVVDILLREWGCK